jgi:3-hydroxybutyryl-CoA dehydrogenase
VKLLDAGVATKEDIDAAMQGGCNFPMGPLALLDLVGLDVSAAIGRTIGADVPERIERMIAEGALGRKAGRGFYTYDG